MTIETDDPVDRLLQRCKSPDEVFVVVSDLEGPDGLLALMQLASDILNRSDFFRASAAIRAAGLDDIAEQIEQAAQDVSECIEENPFNPQADPANCRDWNRRECGDYSGFMFDDVDRTMRLKGLGLIK